MWANNADSVIVFIAKKTFDCNKNSRQYMHLMQGWPGRIWPFRVRFLDWQFMAKKCNVEVMIFKQKQWLLLESQGRTRPSLICSRKGDSLLKGSH